MVRVPPLPPHLIGRVAQTVEHRSKVSLTIFGQATSFAANADGDYILWEDVVWGSNPHPLCHSCVEGWCNGSTRKIVSVNLGRRSFFPPMEVAASHGGVV